MHPSQLKRLLEILRSQLSTIHEALNEQTNATTNKQSTEREEEKEKTGVLRVIAHNIETGNNSAATAHEEDYRQQGALASAQWLTVRWTAGACVAAAIYAAIAVFQWCTMIKTYEEIRTQTIATQKAACAARASADTAANALLEYKRQFDQMYPQIEQQTTVQQQQFALQKMISESQSSPYAWIEVKGVSTTIYDPTHGPQSEILKPRKISITYVVHNTGVAPTLRYASDFVFNVIDLPGSNRIGREPCQSEISAVKFSFSAKGGVIAGQGGQTDRITKPDPEQITWGRGYIQAIGCVAFTGVSKPNQIQTSAILVTIHVDRRKGGATFGSRPILINDQQ